MLTQFFGTGRAPLPASGRDRNQTDLAAHTTRVGVAVASHSFARSPILRQELLARYPGSTFNESGRPLDRDALIELLRGYRKAITGLETLDEALFDALPELRLVSKYGVGLDMIDRDAARRHGVAIRWSPGVNRQAVAELTIALMIAMCRNLLPLAQDVRDGLWRDRGGVSSAAAAQGAQGAPGARQLSSAVVGIVGCGHVGQQVARLCRAFGATVLAHDIRAYDDFYREHDVRPTSFSALLEQSDIVTLHVPLDSSTRGLVGAQELAAMKPGAYLVNTARGGIVDEAAVAAALVEGRLAGAAFDVFTTEPPVNRALLQAPNFIGTPHIGAATHEAVLAMGRAAIAGLDEDSESVEMREGKDRQNFDGAPGSADP
jgi:phosphoglycerate dehydrogenase-like enzyme